MINKTHKVLTIAFVIICIFPFNVLAQDKMDSKLDCEPLPEAERFKALGYELGTCKVDVEKLLKKHPDTNKRRVSIMKKSENEANLKAPDDVSYI